MAEHLYPTTADLEKVKNWQVSLGDWDEFKQLLEFIQLNWWNSDLGFLLDIDHPKKTFKLELHTGGWSGNESIINALKENEWFFALFWRSSHRGGHYHFSSEGKVFS